ncbi:hypothetical protein GCM10020000_74900 [Streptomyces olivoverticillatus]
MLSFERLRRMDPDHHRTHPQRPDFHVLALVRSGAGRHSADFVDHPLKERTVVWIRPGVVHRWTDVDNLEGPPWCCSPRASRPLRARWHKRQGDVFAPACWQLEEDAWELALRASDHLGHEHAAAVSNPRLASPPLLGHLLSALVLRVLPAGPAEPPAEQHRRPGGLPPLPSRGGGAVRLAPPRT